MANQEHVDILRQGVEVWNRWREEHPEVRPDLEGTHLTTVDLRKADLHKANLRNANLREVDLSNAHLSGATLRWANLAMASLNGAIAQGVDLKGARLYKTTLVGVNLQNTDLSYATLVETNFSRANLTGCKIYGISAWDINLEGANQSNLIITSFEKSVITVDNLEIAQFIYLLLNNRKIREVIDTIAKKAVLILGRFTPERKVILDTIRETLRQRDYLPILFDFDKPQSQDLTETVSTLAHLAKFVIVDLTSPSSAPHEIMAIAPHCIVPIQPLFHPDDVAKHEYAMFRDLQRRYHWVLPTHHYQDLDDLLASLQTKVIAPAEHKAQELEKQR